MLDPYHVIYIYNFNSYQVGSEDLLLMLLLGTYTYVPYQHLFSSWYHVGVSSKNVLNEAIFAITTLLFSYITHVFHCIQSCWIKIGYNELINSISQIYKKVLIWSFHKDYSIHYIFHLKWD
jgi:hypothetical protein